MPHRLALLYNYTNSQDGSGWPQDRSMINKENSDWNDWSFLICRLVNYIQLPFVSKQMLMVERTWLSRIATILRTWLCPCGAPPKCHCWGTLRLRRCSILGTSDSPDLGAATSINYPAICSYPLWQLGGRFLAIIKITSKKNHQLGPPVQCSHDQLSLTPCAFYAHRTYGCAFSSLVLMWAVFQTDASYPAWLGQNSMGHE